jgi:hypothetical protein
MAGRLMNNEMGRIWKEVVIEQLRYYICIFVLRDSVNSRYNPHSG